jgi:hypothetical protein
MAAVTTIRQVLNPGLKNSPAVDFFLKYNNEAEKADRVLKSAIGITDIGKMKSSDPMWGKVGSVLDSARSVVSISRTPGIVVKLFTGSIWTHYVQKEIDQDGCVTINGKKVHASTLNVGYESEPSDRIIVKKNTIIQKMVVVKERRDWLDIAMDVLLLVARVLNPICWLNKLGVIDLGKHASRMGTTIGCAFSAVTTLSFVQSIRDLVDSIEEAKPGEAFKDMMSRIKKKVADCFSGLVDMLSIPADCGMAFNASPEMALASACMGVASGVVFLAKEMLISD